MNANGKNNEMPGANGARNPADARPRIDRDDGVVIKLDDAAQQLIGQQLKAVYGEIVRQPIPDKFLQLLDELERKVKGQ
jgi:Anti-sigma factor NepR